MGKNKLKSKQSQKQSQKNNQNVKVVINNDKQPRRRRQASAKAGPVGISAEQSMRLMKTYTPQINNVQPDFNSLISSIRGAMIPQQNTNTNYELGQMRNDILNIRSELRQPAALPAPPPPAAINQTEKVAKPKATDVVDLSAIPEAKAPIIPVQSMPAVPKASEVKAPITKSMIVSKVAPVLNKDPVNLKNAIVPKAASVLNKDPVKLKNTVVLKVAPKPAQPVQPVQPDLASAFGGIQLAQAPKAKGIGRSQSLSDIEEYDMLPKLLSGMPDKRTKQYKAWAGKYSSKKN